MYDFSPIMSEVLNDYSPYAIFVLQISETHFVQKKNSKMGLCYLVRI